MIRLPHRLREREALTAVVLLACLSLILVSHSGTDLVVSGWFFDVSTGGFPAGEALWAQSLYLIVPWVGRSIGVAGLVVALLAWSRPWSRNARWWRRTLFLSTAMALLVGGLVNGVLKENFGRARPVQTSEFGGDGTFTAAWTVSSACTRNCSFVSGHAATGFALIAVGALGSAATRRRWWRIGMAAGLVIGAGRVVQGGHFFSDVVLGGAILWVSICALRWIWLWVVARRRRRHAWGATGRSIRA